MSVYVAFPPLLPLARAQLLPHVQMCTNIMPRLQEIVSRSQDRSPNWPCCSLSSLSWPEDESVSILQNIVFLCLFIVCTSSHFLNFIRRSPNPLVNNTKVEDTEVGAICFVPPGVEVQTKKYARGKQHFDKIKPLIERILEKRNSIEAEAADAYISYMVQFAENKIDDSVKPSRASSRQRQTTSRRSNESGRMDMNWKVNRRHFPKLSSRVGLGYQVLELPAARPYIMDSNTKGEKKSGDNR